MANASTNNWRKWVAVVCIVAAVVTGAWLWKSASSKREAARTRTEVAFHTVANASVERTLRVAGTTAALNSYLSVAPQLGGSRAGRGRQSGGGTNIAAGSAVAAAQSSSSSSSSTSVQAGGRSLSTAMRAATSRTSGLSSSAPVSAAPAAAPSAASSSSGSSLGSTANALVGGGGGGGFGGGRRGDFDLILQELIPTGTKVRKGDVLARFDPELMLLRLDDYSDAVRQAEQSFRILEANLDVQRKAYEQLRATAKAALDKAELDLRTVPVLGKIDSTRLTLLHQEAQARLAEVEKQERLRLISEGVQRRESELNLKQAKLELERVKANIEKLTVKSPADGIAVVRQTWNRGGMRSYGIGDQVRPGENFLTVVAAGGMVLEGRINQVDVQRLRIGQPARIFLDAFPELKFEGSVLSVGSVSGGMFRGAFVSGIPVRIRIASDDARLIPDLSVFADVVVDRSARPAPVVPLQAVQRSGDGKTFVFVKIGPAWQRRDVSLGESDAFVVAVKEGLAAGDVVALAPPPSVNRTS
jgi:multidrug resistance efflux pump